MNKHNKMKHEDYFTKYMEINMDKLHAYKFHII